MVVVEKVMVAKLPKFPSFYGTHRFITILAGTPTINHILDRLIPVLTLPGSILIMTFHLCLNL